MVELVTGSLDDDKAEDVTVIGLTGKSTLADHLVIATGRSQRQVCAMADHLMAKLKHAGHHVSAEGMAAGDWVLLDAGDMIIHLFRPDVRAFYNIEKMWGVPSPARPQAISLPA